jgi:hypothetical protein
MRMGERTRGVNVNLLWRLISRALGSPGVPKLTGGTPAGIEFLIETRLTILHSRYGARSKSARCGHIQDSVRRRSSHMARPGVHAVIGHR